MPAGHAQLPRVAALRQHHWQLSLRQGAGLRHRIHHQRRPGRLRGRGRVRPGHARLPPARLPVPQHTGLIQVRAGRLSAGAGPERHQWQLCAGWRAVPHRAAVQWNAGAVPPPRPLSLRSVQALGAVHFTARER